MPLCECVCVCVYVCVSWTKCWDISHCRVQGTHQKKIGTQTLYFNTTWRIKQSNISRNTPHIIARVDKWQTLTHSNALCMHVWELRECTLRQFSSHKKADHRQTHMHACTQAHCIIFSGRSFWYHHPYKSLWLDQAGIYCCHAPACSGSIYDACFEAEVRDESYNIESSGSFSPFYLTLLLLLVYQIFVNESSSNRGVKRHNNVQVWW